MFIANVLDSKPKSKLEIILGRPTLETGEPPKGATLLYLMSRQGEGFIEELFVDASTGDIYFQRHTSFSEFNGTWYKAARD